MTRSDQHLPSADSGDPGVLQAAIDAAIARCREQRGALLPILHAIQDQLGFVPPSAVDPLAKALNISRADVHGVITFYHDFRSSPPGRHVLKVCRAESCQSVGSERLESRLRERCGVGVHETTKDGSLTVEPVYCLGNCALSPAVMLDGRVFGRVSEERLDELVDTARGGDA